METRSIVLIAGISVAACALAVAIPVGRALYLDAPDFAPDVSALALRVYGQISEGRLDRSLYTDEFNAAYTPDALKPLKPAFQALGPPDGLTLESQYKAQGGMQYVFSAHYSAGDHRLEILLTPAGKVGNFRVTP